MSNTKDKNPAAANKLDNKLFVEKRPEGDFAVRKGNSERAKESSLGALPVVERVRNSTAENPDQWRKAWRHFFINGVQYHDYIFFYYSTSVAAAGAGFGSHAAIAYKNHSRTYSGLSEPSLP